MIYPFVSRCEKNIKQWIQWARNLRNYKLSKIQFKNLGSLLPRRSSFNKTQAIRFLFIVFSPLCIVLVITFALEITKKSMPVHAPIPFIIQKPEPTQIQKIDRSASASEMAQEEYQGIIEKLHQDGEELSPARIRAAIVGLKRVLRRLPVYPSAREALAALLIKQGNLLEADKVIQVGLLQDPGYFPYLKLKLRMLVEQGDIEQAAVLLRDIPSSGMESDLDYLSLIAQIYLQRGQYGQAVQIYRELLKFNGNNPSWLMGLGIALEGLGKLREALDAYQLAQATATPQLREYIEQRIQTLR